MSSRDVQENGEPESALDLLTPTVVNKESVVAVENASSSSSICSSVGKEAGGMAGMAPAGVAVDCGYAFWD